MAVALVAGSVVVLLLSPHNLIVILCRFFLNFASWSRSDLLILILVLARAHLVGTDSRFLLAFFPRFWLLMLLLVPGSERSRMTDIPFEDHIGVTHTRAMKRVLPALIAS